MSKEQHGLPAPAPLGLEGDKRKEGQSPQAGAVGAACQGKLWLQVTDPLAQGGLEEGARGRDEYPLSPFLRLLLVPPSGCQSMLRGSRASWIWEAFKHDPEHRGC